MSKMKKLLQFITAPKKALRYINRRLTVKGFYKWQSDEAFLKKEFRYSMGKALNLENPQTYNEKLQWLKLYDRKTIYNTMVDKYEAKKYVADIIGEEYIIPTLGVWDKFEDIDFDKLPEQFVLKCTHDSGGLSICRDKSKFDKKKAEKKIKRSLKKNFYWSGREWPYKDVKPRIIAEVYMDDEAEAKGLTDYKFFCFNGEAKLLYVSQGLENHDTASISFYDMNGEEMPFHRKDFKPMKKGYKVPSSFDEMTRLANQIAQKVQSPFVRVDLYSVRGSIYFSEITFYPCSGMVPFEPEEWDKTLGDWITLPEKTDK